MVHASRRWSRWSGSSSTYRRPLRLHRQRLRRRPEGPHHARGVRQGRAHRRRRGPAPASPATSCSRSIPSPIASPHRRPRPGWRASGATSPTSRASLASLGKQVELSRAERGRRASRLRPQDPAARATASARQSDLDKSRMALVAAKAQLEQLEQQERDAPQPAAGRRRICRSRSIPQFIEATRGAAAGQARPANTVLRAPIAGIATQVTSIQMGRYLTAGMAVFSIIGTDSVWVDANPKETDLTYVRAGPAGRHHASMPSPTRRWRGTGGGDQPRHRRAVRHPAAAERRRQLDQDRAARAGPRSSSSRARTCAACARA